MKRYSIILLTVAIIFGINMLPAFSLERGAEFVEMNQINSEEERFIVRLRTEDGQIIEDAWITLRVDQREENEIRNSPPVFYEFTHEIGRIYVAEIIPHRVVEKKFTLTVQAEGYEMYQVSFENLNNDVTVRLQPI